MTKQVDHEFYQKTFLTHICLLSGEKQDKYFDIIESIQFAHESNNKKLDFEFNNLCDFLDETGYTYSVRDKVFEYWGEF